MPVLIDSEYSNIKEQKVLIAAIKFFFVCAFTDLNLYWIKGALAFVCFSFFLPAQRYASAVLLEQRTRPSVCPSVCHTPVLYQNEESYSVMISSQLFW